MNLSIRTVLVSCLATPYIGCSVSALYIAVEDTLRQSSSYFSADLCSLCMWSFAIDRYTVVLRAGVIFLQSVKFPLPTIPSGFGDSREAGPPSGRKICVQL